MFLKGGGLFSFFMRTICRWFSKFSKICQMDITADFIADSLHIPFQEASDALKRAIGAISII